MMGDDGLYGEGGVLSRQGWWTDSGFRGFCEHWSGNLPMLVAGGRAVIFGQSCRYGRLAVMKLAGLG